MTDHLGPVEPDAAGKSATAAALGPVDPDAATAGWIAVATIAAKAAMATATRARRMTFEFLFMICLRLN